MKNLANILFAGAMFAAVAFAQVDDHGANAQFHMKTGRDLPGYTSQSAKPAMKCCAMTACNMTSPQPSDAEQRIHSKTGRYSPAEEARLATPAPEVAKTMPAPTDAADRVRAKTGRSTVQMAKSTDSDCMTMGCCKRS